jgi:putative sigma-54 modulation protein
VTIWANGSILRAEEKSADLFAAVDAVTDKMERQIERFKGKRRRRRQQGAPAAAFPASLEMEEEEEAGSGPAIVRVKQFPISPMSVEEAIDQMELLGHDFFVFYNADTNSMNVVYRRKDGNYGLLQPELA